jgi:hypothetical protein
MASAVELGILRAVLAAAAAEDVEKEKAAHIEAMERKEAELVAEVAALTSRLAALARKENMPPPRGSATAPAIEPAPPVVLEAPATARLPAPPVHDKALSGGRAKLLRSILTPYLNKVACPGASAIPLPLTLAGVCLFDVRAQHAPDEANNVDAMILRVVGREADLTEEELFEDLEVAYGVRVDLDPHEP